MRMCLADIVLNIAVMPGTRAAPAVRVSPRKRKIVDAPVKDVALAQHESNQTIESSGVQSESVRPTKRPRTKARAIPSSDSPSTSARIEPVVLDASPRVVKSKVKAEITTSTPTKTVKTKKSGKTTPVKDDLAVKREVKEQSESKTSSKAKNTIVPIESDDKADQDKEKPKKVVRKRMTKEEKEAAAMPLAARTTGLKMYVGAHVSIAKGVENAITNSLHIGANAFALFLKNQKRWENPTLKDENRDAFKHRCIQHTYDQASHAVPHGSYLVNLASPDPNMSKKSYDTFVDDLHRCEALGIKYYNFHPGTTNKEPLDEAIARLAANLNRALAETTTVVPLLENMAGRGSVIGSRFSDLRDIIAAIRPEFKSRIGICIDTCHTFAAGYDLRTPQAYQKTFQELDQTVGLQYLKAMHLNDSKAPLSSHRDLHQNIGVGFLGLRAFHNVMNDARLENIPLVLETPGEDKSYQQEIKLLESLIGMDPESEEFKVMEKDLSEKGKAEREAMEKSINNRDEKARKKAQRALEKGQKSIGAMLGAKSKKRAASPSSSSSLSDAESDA